MYHQSEEQHLMELLSSSKLIDREELLYIKRLYSEFVPYHNFIHAMSVAESVLHLPASQFSIIEIKSLFIAALFHDAGHLGTASDLDEFRSLELAIEGIIDFEKRYNYEGIDYSIVRKAIIGTVFKNRSTNSNIYARLMADLDVCSLGKDFSYFLYYCDFWIMEEFQKSVDTWKFDVGYFKFLTWVDKNVFRTEIMRELFPHAHKNIRKYLSMDIEEYKEIYTYYSRQDISYDMFKKEYEILDK